MSENNKDDWEDIVDSMLDGNVEVQDHSLDMSADEQSEAEKNAAPETKTENVFDSAQNEKSEEENNGAPPHGDSEPEEKKTDFDVEIAALRAENETLKKRFHDTQQAMHKANTEKSELQKRLDAVSQKSDTENSDDDDWFEDSDKDDGAKDVDFEDIKKKFKALESRQEQYQQELMRQQWLDEAEKFAKEHDDFENLVYEKLEPLLDENSGDPMLRALYLQQADRSPAGAYEFAKKLFEYKNKLDGKPEAVKEKTENNTVKETQPARGKAGLDRINSADFSEEKKSYSNVIDEIFG